MKKLAQQEKKSWIVTAKKFRSEPVWILRIEIAAFSGVVSFWFHQICVLSGIRQKQTNRKPGDTPTDKKRMDNMTCCLLSELPGNRWRDLEQERRGADLVFSLHRRSSGSGPVRGLPLSPAPGSTTAAKPLLLRLPAGWGVGQVRIFHRQYDPVKLSDSS